MTQEAQTQLDAIVRRWKNKRGTLIMMLHEIQAQRGCVPRELALELSRATDIPLARIYEVLTFFSYFRIEPPGRAMISVCTGTACHLKGADALLEAFHQELGITEGETTADGDFCLQSVRCVGCCGLAPVITVNGKTYGRAVPTDIPGIIAEWRQQLALEAKAS